MSVPRGLATVALLKTRLDEGKDHLGLFEPFVEDAVSNLSMDHFAAADLRSAVDERHGLLLPVETIETLLGRLKRNGTVRREGGRYFRVLAARSTAISEAKQQVQEQLDMLGAALQDFARNFPTHSIVTSQDALALILAFLHENNVALLLAEEPDGLPSGLTRQQQRVVARFVTQECVRREELKTILESLLEGLVLKNALLLQDLDTAAQRFDNVAVYLDSQILLGCLDLTGVAQGIAARDTLALLRGTGAMPAAFDVTLAELRRLFGMLEDHLATAEGRLSLRPTPLVRHVLSSDLRPSDMRILSGSLEPRLRQLGIRIRDTPPRDRRFTLNEDALARELTDATQDVNQYRVRHDVDCIAAVLTLRANRHPRRVESCQAIFATTSPRVIRNVTTWYRSQGAAGLAPIIDFRALTNLAWLKKPASAKSLKVHELVALCWAALRPSRKTWEKFVANLREMREQGVLTDEETVAIVASDLADPILADLEDDREPDAVTIHEAIDRVKASYRDQGYRAAQEAIDEAQAQAQLATQAARISENTSSNLNAHLEAKSRRAGAMVAKLAVFGLTVVVVGTIAIAIPGVLENIPLWLRPMTWVLLAASAILTFWGYWSGFSIRDLQAAIERRVSAAILRYLRPMDTDH